MIIDAETQKSVNDALVKFHADNAEEPMVMLNKINGRRVANQIERLLMYEVALESLRQLPNHSFVIFIVQDVWSEGLFVQSMVFGNELLSEIAWLPFELYDVAQKRDFTLYRTYEQMIGEDKSGLKYAMFQRREASLEPRQLALITEEMLVSATESVHYTVELQTSVESHDDEEEEDQQSKEYYKLSDKIERHYKDGELEKVIELSLKSIPLIPDMFKHIKKRPYWMEESEWIEECERVEGSEKTEIKSLLANDYLCQFMPILHRKEDLRRAKSLFSAIPELLKCCQKLDHALYKEELMTKIEYFLRNNPGFIQSNFKKEFPSDYSDIAEMLYWADRLSLIKREKSGNSYKVYLKRQYLLFRMSQ